MKRWSNGFAILVLCGLAGGCSKLGFKSGDAVPPSSSAVSSPAASAPPAAPSPIDGIRWKLVHLEGDPVVIPDSPREPHFVLREGRVTGSGGCNRLSGDYKIDGKHLRFGQIVATKMFCPDAMDYEQPLFNVLNWTGSWRLTGKQLELFDGGGLPLARFESRAEARPAAK